MNSNERTLAASTARLLQAAVRSSAPLGLGCAALAAGALAWAPPAGAAAPWLAAGVLATSLLERVLAFRLRFDAGLFTDLARSPGPLPESLGALDLALSTLGLRQAGATPRPLIDRSRGARRLLVWHLLCVGAQVGLLAAALLQRGAR